MSIPSSRSLRRLVERFGDVRVGRGVFVAGNTVLRADPGTRVCLGSATNVQDNVLVLGQEGSPARRGPCGSRAISAGDETSIAHQAEVIDTRVGEFVFVGVRAHVANAVLEDGVFVLHGARVRDVRIPRDRIVPVGAVITTQAQADALELKTEANAEFQREVLEVNREFAEGYAELYEDEGFEAVTDVSAAPRTEFNEGAEPTIGQGLDKAPFARIVGDVRLGDRVAVGRRTSIRADEGAPIVIGDDAVIEERVTFHALRGTDIRIGRGLDTDDNVVFHGPLSVGDDLTIADDAVLFRAEVGDGVTIGDGALVIGPADAPLRLRSGATVPAGAIITSQAQADALT
jgi:carbon dioxide concentrating mechanism protein CcmM